MNLTNGGHKHNKIRDILTEETGGKSYKAHKYSLDVSERPTLDYGNSHIKWKKTAETSQHTKYVDLKKLCTCLAKNDQILSYFLDGSRRVFKVDDVAYYDGRQNMIYPIIAGQIGIGCCHRENKQMKPEIFKGEIVLSIPNIANADGKSGFFPAMVTKLNDCEDLKRLDLKFNAILPYSTSKKDGSKFEDKATACVQDRMIEGEKKLVADLVRKGKLNQDNYLIKDGSLEYRPTLEDKKDKKRYQIFKNNYNWVLGVSKNFNPDVCLDVNGKPSPGFIADLPLYHRTPVACYENLDYLGDIKFAIWYIRLRDQKQTRTPFDGILKVEKILVTEDEINIGIDSELVDTLSALLINERNPVCYGSDLRWANHIYPIYLTESFVKSKYLSTDSFLHLF